MGVQLEQGRWVLNESLLSATTATTNGTWVRAHGIHPFSVTVSGSGTFSVIIYVSNDPTVPSDSDNTQPQLGETISNGAGAILSDGPYRWVKARVSAYTSGTIGASLLAAAEARSK